MLNELIDFVDSILPSVDPEAKDKAKAAISQFHKNGNCFELLLPKQLPSLSQGNNGKTLLLKPLVPKPDIHIFRIRAKSRRDRITLLRFRRLHKQHVPFFF